MILTIYYDGQFWVGIIEIREGSRLKAYRHVFGAEPSDAEVLEFVNSRLLSIIQNSGQDGVKVNNKTQKKINPKRLQRQVAKEMKKQGISTKAQEAIKADFEKRKQESQLRHKEHREALKEKKWEMKRQKAKQKHKGK
ncbi:hypothetical protein JOD45_000372 [Scopulibacillus daqui]|uniref:DUF2992 family protein n=1 Tax=Scopulibacillus daqui TaxID=1469162 RepID=A0ABS2PWD2_9BACL|nr:hypothetical protein [Scopulibacillus daqui]